LANRVLGSEAEFANSIEAKEIVDKMTTSIEVAELEDQLKKFPEYDSKYSLEVNIYTILYNNGGKEQLQGALMLGGMMTGSMAVTIATAVGDNALDGKELITPDILLAALVSSKLKVRGAVKGPSATTQIVHLDTNALVRALDRGEVAAIDAALAGRTPVVSITAAKEYLAKGDVEVLRQFLSERGGRIGSATTQAEIDNLIQQANALGRVLKASDASVAGSAIKEGATLITNDARLARFLRAVGFKVEGH
ncbi:type II toxin-antitoxin system VapC family toxin, partial [Acetonema longum]